MGRISSWISKLDDSAAQHREEGIENVFAGFKKMFGLSKQLEFNDPADVLNYLLSEVTKGNCEHQQLNDNDSYETVLTWARNHVKGNKFYMVRAKFNSGEHAIGVFFADDARVYVEKNDPKICFTCKEIPTDIFDLFDKKSIFVQSFN